jgi:hypothetical protein
MVCSELALDLAQPKFAGEWTMEDDQAGAQVREARGPRLEAAMMMVLLRPRERQGE